MNSLNIYERLVYISISELNLSFQQTFDRLHRKEDTIHVHKHRFK